jgi:molybdopterin/thiamine biosynthesis adenylyltransferase
MKYTISMTETLFDAVRHHLSSPELECAGYLLGKTSVTSHETRVLLREFIPVERSEVTAASRTGMSIMSSSFMRAMKRADRTNQVFYFIHSHPGEYRNFSEQDDKQEAQLMHTAYTRIEKPGPHGSMLLVGGRDLIARSWFDTGVSIPITRIRIIGTRLRFIDEGAEVDLDAVFDRQIVAFGGGIQALLRRLHVGVVGLGGTGSAVAEQLIRLGVGTLTVIDHDDLERSNVSRVYGSTLSHVGKPKVAVAHDNARRIGLDTDVRGVASSITYERTAAILRECDCIFGCTDDEWGRAILTRMALYYYIPVIDMGVRIASESGQIKNIQGRVTTLLPGAACLFCRNRISAEQVSRQAIDETNPERASKLRAEGYLPELPGAEPAVIAFNSTLASWAVIELLNRIVGFMGEERRTTEMIFLFDAAMIRPNAVSPSAQCFCSDPRYLGRGDVKPFLDMTWRADEEPHIAD